MLSAAQKELRRHGIGGSEIASIVGLDPRFTAFDTYLRKAEGFEQADNADMERGRFLEPGIADWYGYRTGMKLTEPGTILHRTSPVALCTPDRLAMTGDGIRVVSIKAPGPFPDGFGDPGTDSIPAHYNLQGQWEGGILRSHGDPVEPDWDLAAPINGDLCVFTIPYDAELFGLLLTSAERFWVDHVEKKVPPPLEGSTHVGAWLKRKFPTSGDPMREATREEEVLALELMEAEAAFSRAELRCDAVTARLKERIASAEGLYGTFGKITWKSDRNGKRSFKARWRT